MPLAAGVAFGAVISPTDAVAATSIGRKLGLPHRLMVVLEAESLFNDATALVGMRTAVAALPDAPDHECLLCGGDLAAVLRIDPADPDQVAPDPCR
ncbi:MAG: cation:proton antiporter [Propioniciclava sp.]